MTRDARRTLVYTGETPDSVDMESESQPIDPSRCSAMNVRGERCGKRAVRGRYCLVHAGEQSMRELGRKGGLVKPRTKLRANVDDQLREQARDVLARALAGEKVEKTALDSARSLFSYRADAPPAGQAPAPDQEGRMVFGIGDLVAAAVELGVLEGKDMKIGGVPVVAEMSAPLPPPEKTPEPRGLGALDLERPGNSQEFV